MTSSPVFSIYCLAHKNANKLYNWTFALLLKNVHSFFLSKVFSHFWTATLCLQPLWGWWQQRPNILWGGTKGRRDAKRRQMERGNDEDLCVRQTTSMLHNSPSTSWQRLYLPPDCAHVPSPREIFLRGGAWTGERSRHKWELSVYTDDYPDCSRRTNKQKTGRSREPGVNGSPTSSPF